MLLTAGRQDSERDVHSSSHLPPLLLSNAENPSPAFAPTQRTVPCPTQCLKHSRGSAHEQNYTFVAARLPTVEPCASLSR
mmetsp:Transcript_532/g.1091  ORF Transcript_532/g.1091 Transcript_532/m.1091 type:complete len:80 (-) Transcript_532:64-303(-)